MNLVDMIKDQVTSEITGKLGSLLGTNEVQAKSAMGAAIPALLAGLAGTASNESGASKLASAFNNLDSNALSSIQGLITREPEEAANKGGDLLGSLLGGSAMTAIVGALVKFLGSNPAMMKKLLGFAAPFVMSSIMKQFQGKPATAHGLTSLFNSQKSNISSAIPAGLSLADVPGISSLGAVARDFGNAGRNVGRDVERTARAAQDSGSSLMKALLPIGALALLGFLAWKLFSPAPAPVVNEDVAVTNRELIDDYEAQRPVTQPEVTTPALPDLSQFTGNLNGVYSTLTDTLKGITDVQSAEAALPQFTELNSKIESLSAVRSQLPEAGRAAVTQIAKDHMGPIQALIEKVMAIPGVKETLEPVLSQIVTKLTGFGQ